MGVGLRRADVTRHVPAYRVDARDLVPAASRWASRVEDPGTVAGEPGLEVEPGGVPGEWSRGSASLEDRYVRGRKLTASIQISAKPNLWPPTLSPAGAVFNPPQAEILKFRDSGTLVINQ